jgi:hypothetical protein
MRRFLSAAVAACVLSSPHSARAAGPTKLLKGPYLTNASESAVEVRFELDAPGPATVEFPGKPPVVDASSLTAHAVRVAGLDPSRRNDFFVRAGGLIVGKGSVPPWPKAGAPMSVVVYGNSHGDPSAHGTVVHLVGALPSDFLIDTGDVVDDASRGADWQSFFDVEAPVLRDRPLLLVPGERDFARGEAGESFSRYFGRRSASPRASPGDAQSAIRVCRSTRVSNVRLFLFDEGAVEPAGDSRDELTRMLSSADNEVGVLWRIAVTHRRPWSLAPGDSGVARPTSDVLTLLAAHKVDLVLAGHDALYERGDLGVLKYVVSGGGGAPLDGVDAADPAAQKVQSVWHAVALKTDGDSVAIEARRVDGVVLDKCSFRKGTAWECTSAATAIAAPVTTPHVPRPLASAFSARAEPPAPFTPTAERSSESRSRWASPWPWAWAAAAVGLCGGIIAIARRRRRM